MDLNVMMKYRRRQDCWICPVCETENATDAGKCYLCGSIKTDAAHYVRAWSAEDEARERANATQRAQTVNVPPRGTGGGIPPVRPITPPPATKIFVDEDAPSVVLPPEKKKSKALVIIIIIVILLAIIGAFFGLMYSNYSDTYSEALSLYNSEQYAQALEKFESLPADYKNTSSKIKDTKYQMGLEYLEQGDVQSAKDMFTQLGDYSDSAEMLKECDYVNATMMLNNGQYEEAKTAFEALGDYSDSSDMVSECDYQQATAYYYSSDYVLAMAIFNSLSYYKDSDDMFDYCVYGLTNENSSAYRYTDEYDMLGYWTDYNGHHVNYTESDYNMHVSYEFPYTNGTYFKVENGLHSHGSDYYWTKQWIFEYVSYNTANVYNFKDGKVYEMTRTSY